MLSHVGIPGHGLRLDRFVSTRDIAEGDPGFHTLHTCSGFGERDVVRPIRAGSDFEPIFSLLQPFAGDCSAGGERVFVDGQVLQRLVVEADRPALLDVGLRQDQRGVVRSTTHGRLPAGREDRHGRHG